MAFPQNALPLVGELYVGSLGWLDISSDIRQASAKSGGGITIDRGRSSEGRQVDPGRCSFVLNNRHGKYSPRNPRSAYYGLIGRNTPVRVGVEMFRDTFSRTVASGLGTSDGGDVWTASIPTAWSVSAGKVTGTFAAPNDSRLASLIGSDCVDSDQVAVITPSVVMTGATLVAGFVARYDSVSGDYYWLRVEFDVLGVVRVKLSKRVGGVGTELGTASTGLTYSAGAPMQVRASVVGSRLAVKVWPASQPEPRDWHLTADDTSLTQGRVGLFHWLVPGNTNTPTPTVSYDNYRVILPRFFGEISSWPSKWDLSGNDVWVSTEASGILRRLNQGKKALRSPIFRNLSQYSPTLYLTLEDGSGSVAPANAVAGARAATSVDVTFGADDSLPGAATTAKLNSATSSITVANNQGYGRSTTHRPGLPPTSNLAAWSHVVYFKMDSIPTTTDVLYRLKGNGKVTEWTLTVSNNSYRWIGIDSTGAEVVNLLSAFGSGAQPNRWVAMHLGLVQNGGFVDVSIYWHNVGSPTFYTTPPTSYVGTVGQISTLALSLGTLPPTLVGHAAVFPSPVPFVDHEFAEASNGYVGETAGARIQRLGIEEGVSVRLVGDPAETEPVGRQRADSFLNLLESSALVDGGILYEDRSDLALIYRARNTLYNQTATALSYSARHISEPFEPVEDDDAIRNDVTVTRDGGSSSRVTLDSGPLSVLSPPNGVGIYDETVSLNLAYDTQALDEAGWRVHLGTADEARYPKVRINLASGAWSTDQVLTRKAAALDSGKILSIGALPDWLPPGPVKLMVQGYTERLDAYTWDITWNATPGSVWDVAAVDGTARVGVETSSLVSAITSSATSLSVSSAANELWTTTEVPLDILVGGERMTVTAISGASSPQTFTVIRAINGIVKAHSIDSPVDVAQPAVVPV